MNSNPDRWMLFLGAGRTQSPFIEAAARAGLRTLVFDRNSEAPGAKLATRFVEIDLSQIDAVVATARADSAFASLVGCLAYSAAPFVLTACSRINDACGARWFQLPKNLLDADKVKIKEALRAAGIKTPAWSVAHDMSTVDEFLRQHKSCVMKPASHGRGSLGVVRVNDFVQGRRAFNAVAAMSADGTVLLEQFEGGPEFTVDGYAQDGDCHLFHCARKFSLGPDAGFLMTGFATGDRPDSILRRHLGSLTQSVADTLQITDSFFSLDVVETAEGYQVIDVGVLLDARVDRLLHFVGIDVYDLAVKLMLGEDVEFARPPGGYALRFIYPIGAGRLTFLDPHLPYYIAFERERRSGERVDTPRSVAGTVGWLMTRAGSMESAWQTVEAVQDGTLHHIEMEPT